MGDTKSFQASIECMRMQQTYHHSIGKWANEDIVLFPLGGSSFEGKRVDFTSDHGVAHYLFQHLSFFLQPYIYTLAFKVTFLFSKVTLMSSLWMAGNFSAFKVPLLGIPIK